MTVEQILQDQMLPEQIRSYIEQKYAELREKAATYGELKKLIIKEVRYYWSNIKAWNDLLGGELEKMYEKEVSDLPIQQAASNTTNQS